jgi:hypothetical protein
MMGESREQKTRIFIIVQMTQELWSHGKHSRILPNPKVEIRGDLDPLLMSSVFIVWQILCSSSTDPSVMSYICGRAS